MDKLRTKITSSIAKSTSPGLSDTTFFTQTLTYEVPIEHSMQIITFVVAISQFQHTSTEFLLGNWASAWVWFPAEHLPVLNLCEQLETFHGVITINGKPKVTTVC